MKTLKNPFVMFGRIALSLGVAFLAGFIISIFVNRFQLSRPRSAPKEDLNAVVYVNSKNPRDYFVEINSKVGANNKYDYDYR